MSTGVDERHHFDVKTAIEAGDATALRRILAEVPVRANELIRWGRDCRIATHPLHYVSDMLCNGVLPKGKELGLVEVLIQAGADLNFQKEGKDTPLIGAASLGAEEVGLKLLDAGARPELRGGFGETALHWAALLGEDRLAGRPSAGVGTSKASTAFRVVKDVAAEVAELKARGVVFEEYDMPGIKMENSIASAWGAKTAWFKDSEGNILAVSQRVSS